MRTSSRVTRRGVNARDTSDRSCVWSGGSMKIMIPPPITRSDISSSTVPCAELNVDGSRCAASTSS